MLVDITERRQEEASRAHLAAIVSSSDDAIFSLDLDGRIQSWNRGAEELFGYQAQDAIGNPLTFLIPQNRQAEEPASFSAFFPVNESTTMRPSGSIRMAGCSMSH